MPRHKRSTHWRRHKHPPTPTQDQRQLGLQAFRAGRLDEAIAVWSELAQQPSPASVGLLARARQVAAQSTGDTDLLETAIAALDVAVRRGDQAAVEAQSEELLDLLYDLDEA